MTLAVASGTESRIGSGAAAMAVRHLERGILHSCAPTLPVRQLCPGRSPRLAVAYQVAVFIEACSRAHVAPGPCSLPRGNAPRNSSPNRTEADR